jgi:Transmembrane domain of unknown function (DUF3566)
VVTARAGTDGFDDDTGEETRPANGIAAKRTSRVGAGQAASSSGNGSDGTVRGSVATSDAPASSANGEPAAAEDLALDESAATEPGPVDSAAAEPAVAEGSAAEPAVAEASAAEPAVAEAPARPAEDATLATAPANGHRVANDNDDGVPAYPADNLLPSRVSRFKKGADDHFLDSSSPAFSFGEPETAPVSLSTDRWTPSDSTETHQEPSVSDPSPAKAASGVATAESSSAEPPAVSPAAFAWEMPDPPPDSPSSPARSFLRTGSAPPKTATAVKTPAAGAATATADTGSATRAARGESPVTFSAMPKKRPSKKSARQAHLTVARVEPWSVMKFSFVVSLVAFVILFVAVSVLYGALSGLGVFDSLQRVVTSVTSSQSSAGVNAAKWWSASRILGYTALLGSLNIVLITAMSTIGAVVYNLTTRLVGGVEVTLRETD